MLSRRLQVLIDDERYKRLAREAERAGAPIGELVRRAIDHEYPPVGNDRGAAAERLLAMAPPTDAEPDWDEQKRELLDVLDRKAR
jgi:ribbon-helix-helix CopG family protein